MRLLLPLALLPLGFAGALFADDGTHKWVDEKGQIHITTSPPPKGAGAVPQKKAPERWLYEWRADGAQHVTTTPPPPGGELLERVEDPRPPGRSARERARSAAALRSPKGVGQRAPELMFSNGAGDDLELVDLRGQVVWLTFGSRHGARALAQAMVSRVIADEADETVTVLFVVSASGDGPRARRFADEHDLPRELVVMATPEAFPLGEVPFHVFVDRTGRVRELRTGPLGVEAARAILRSLR